MKKNKLTILMALLLVFTISNVSAVQYYQAKTFIDDDTTRNRASFFWEEGSGISDHIKSGSKFEAYVRYDIYLSTWNQMNLNYSVDNCNFTIGFSDSSSGLETILYNNIFTSADEDISIGKYFIQMDRGDGFYAQFDCKFAGNRPESLEMPITLAIVTPTWECKECQYYEWSRLQIDVEKAKTIGDNTKEVVGYIKELIILNYEFIVIFFWIFLISIGWFSFSLIFIGVYWLYLYLRGVSNIR